MDAVKLRLAKRRRLDRLTPWPARLCLRVPSPVEKRGAMNDLVRFLCNGEHPVEAKLRENTRQAVKDCIGRRFIQIRFTDTRGGTQLGVPIDPERSDLRALESENAGAEIKVVGDITLDYVPVTCVARIDLATFQGEGHLELREARDASSEPAEEAADPD
jgi:hypothetical protein